MSHGSASTSKASGSVLKGSGSQPIAVKSGSACGPPKKVSFHAVELEASDDETLEPAHNLIAQDIRPACDAKASHVDPPIGPQAASTATGSQPSAQMKAALSAQEVESLLAVVHFCRQKQRDELKSRVSADLYELILKVYGIEAVFLQDWRTLASRMVQMTWNAVDRHQAGRASLHGFDPQVQKHRRAMREELLQSREYDKWAEEQTLLEKTLCQDVLAACSHFSNDDLRRLPLASFTRDALEAHADLARVSQPRASSPEGYRAMHLGDPQAVGRRRVVSYKELLVERGLIIVPPNHKGRKPAAGCAEEPAGDTEQPRQRTEGQWAKWWITLGGFEASSAFYVDAVCQRLMRRFAWVRLLCLGRLGLTRSWPSGRLAWPGLAGLRRGRRNPPTVGCVGYPEGGRGFGGNQGRVAPGPPPPFGQLAWGLPGRPWAAFRTAVLAGIGTAAMLVTGYVGSAEGSDYSWAKTLSPSR